MDEAMLQAYARLTTHEFMLEIMYANWFANLPEANAKQISADLRSRMRRAYSSPDAAADVTNSDLRVAADAAVLADRFLDKVDRRAAEIRAKQFQDPYRTL